MGALFTLIGGFKGVAIIALIIALGGWIGVQKFNLSKAETARDQAIAERDMAATQRDKAIEAAKVNEKTIANLQQERDLANQALNTLQSARTTNRTNTVTREVIIQNQAGVPANQAIGAPVLGAIISEVQVDRQRRRGIVPVPVTPAASRPTGARK